MTHEHYYFFVFDSIILIVIKGKIMHAKKASYSLKYIRITVTKMQSGTIPERSLQSNMSPRELKR